MCIYTEFKEKQQNEISKFPIQWAFSENQLKEAMLKLNVNSREDLATIGAGSVLKKEDVNKWFELMNKQNIEKNDLIKTNDTFVYEMFKYELNNYEYAYTQDLTEMFEHIGLDYEKVMNNERLVNILSKAKEEYLNKMDY